MRKIQKSITLREDAIKKIESFATAKGHLTFSHALAIMLHELWSRQEFDRRQDNAEQETLRLKQKIPTAITLLQEEVEMLKALQEAQGHRSMSATVGWALRRVKVTADET